jgi:hypothetical protein
MSVFTGTNCSVFVSTSNDRSQSECIGTGRLGGQVEGIMANIADVADRIPTIQGKAVILTFTTQTRLNTGHRVNINSELFLASGSLTITPTDRFFVSASGSNAILTATPTDGILPGTFTVTISGIAVGPPNLSPRTTVSTTTDLAKSITHPALGGEVSALKAYCINFVA